MNDATSPSSAPVVRTIGLVFIVAIVVAGIVILYMLRTGKELESDLKNAFKPNVIYKTVLSGVIGELNNNPKLVVLTADVIAEVTVTSKKSWMGLDLGDTITAVKAPAKVQYFVPLRDLGENNFVFNSKERQLTVIIPRPVLDTEMVFIETDPAKLDMQTQAGWLRFHVSSAKYTEDMARKNLKEAALNVASNELLIERAEKNAREQILKLILPISTNLADDVSVGVKFKTR